MVPQSFRDLRFEVPDLWKVQPDGDPEAEVTYRPSKDSEAVINLYCNDRTGEFADAAEYYERNYGKQAPDNPNIVEFRRLEDYRVQGGTAYHVSFLHSDEESCFYVEQYIFDSPSCVCILSLSIPEATPMTTQVLQNLLDRVAFDGGGKMESAR